MKGAPAPILSKPLVSAEPTNVVIDTVKPAEDGKGFVVRLYESSGATTGARLAFATAPRTVEHSNTLEDAGEALPLTGNTCALPLRPFQIVTLRVE